MLTPLEIDNVPHNVRWAIANKHIVEYLFEGTWFTYTPKNNAYVAYSEGWQVTNDVDIGKFYIIDGVLHRFVRVYEGRYFYENCHSGKELESTKLKGEVDIGVAKRHLTRPATGYYVMKGDLYRYDKPSGKLTLITITDSEKHETLVKIVDRFDGTYINFHIN